jgi:hypothetical protein
METNKISENILKRKTLDQIYRMLKEKKSIFDPLYKSTTMYQTIGVNTIGSTLGGPNVNLQSVPALPNIVTTNQDFSYLNGIGIFGGIYNFNLAPEVHQPSGTYNGSISNVMLNLAIPEPVQSIDSLNIEMIGDDDW